MAFIQDSDIMLLSRQSPIGVKIYRRFQNRKQRTGCARLPQIVAITSCVVASQTRDKALLLIKKEAKSSPERRGVISPLNAETNCMTSLSPITPGRSIWLGVKMGIQVFSIGFRLKSVLTNPYHRTVDHWKATFSIVGRWAGSQCF